MIFDIGKIVDHLSFHNVMYIFGADLIFNQQSRAWQKNTTNNLVPGRKTQPTISCLAGKHNQQSRAWQKNTTNNLVPGRKTQPTISCLAGKR